MKFASKTELLAYSRKFSAFQLERFEKDQDICLTGKIWKNGSEATHAYFPALISCIGFQELFCGLYNGKLDSVCFDGIKKFTSRFMPKTYPSPLLEVLYNCFRNKVAHLAHPYDVFDTSTKSKAFLGHPPMRMTWYVTDKRFEKSVELEKVEEGKTISRAPDGWKVPYDHVVHVSIPQLRDEIVAAVMGDKGYLNALLDDQTLRDNFERCMNEYFKPAPANAP